jgi:NAD(P)-dependent dehydrogenase (short-subunit alcohol dehydrogenase family)
MCLKAIQGLVYTTGVPMHIVIQGAGRGIGLALARHAFKSGATHLYLTARNPDESEGYRLLPPSDRISWFKLDFLDLDSIAVIGTAISDATPRIDRAITAAGTLHDDAIQPEKTITALAPDAMMRLYQINAMGPALFFRALWPKLRASNGVRLASLSARVGSISDNRLGGWHSYRASKAALNQYLRNISIELARYNPTACVVALHPGTVDTALSKPFQNKLAKDQLRSPEETAMRLWSVIDDVHPQNSGGFFAYDGTPIAF